MKNINRQERSERMNKFSDRNRNSHNPNQRYPTDHQSLSTFNDNENNLNKNYTDFPRERTGPNSIPTPNHAQNKINNIFFNEKEEQRGGQFLNERDPHNINFGLEKFFGKRMETKNKIEKNKGLVRHINALGGIENTFESTLYSKNNNT